MQECYKLTTLRVSVHHDCIRLDGLLYSKFLRSYDPRVARQADRAGVALIIGIFFGIFFSRGVCCTHTTYPNKLDG
jgi:hypothetical protein